LIWLIEVAFVILILSLIYRRYIRPLIQAYRGMGEAMKDVRRQRAQHVDPASAEPIAPKSPPREKHRIDRGKIQDADFEDLS
jgi:hypothetical protein